MKSTFTGFSVSRCLRKKVAGPSTENGEGQIDRCLLLHPQSEAIMVQYSCCGTRHSCFCAITWPPPRRASSRSPTNQLLSAFGACPEVIAAAAMQESASRSPQKNSLVKIVEGDGKLAKEEALDPHANCRADQR